MSYLTLAVLVISALTLQVVVGCGACGAGGCGTGGGAWSSTACVETGATVARQTVVLSNHFQSHASNNFGFRNDIYAGVADDGSTIDLVVGGCPDHGWHENSVNLESSSSSSTSGCCSGGCGACSSNSTCSGGCGACSSNSTCSGGCGACSSGCCSGGCGACSSGCCSGGCSTCSSNSTCSGGCGACSSGCCSSGCCSSGCCSSGCCSSGCCSGGCGACSSGCCSSGCCSTGCCSGDCSSACCGTYCCGSCGSCGGCGGCCSGCGSLGKYTPSYHVYEVSLPANPQIAVNTTSLNNHEVIGIAVNGVVFDSLPLVLSFDDCLGHTDTDHSYHYHIPPKCLLESLGVSVPTNDSWWYGTWPQSRASFWAPTDHPSPVVGYALDGFPIYGPYDESGSLMTHDQLDECNGKFVAGSYRYHLTPDAPYTIGCFRGTPAEITKSPASSITACPVGGITNEYLVSGSTEANALRFGLEELELPTCGYYETSTASTKEILGYWWDFYVRVSISITAGLFAVVLYYMVTDWREHGFTHDVPWITNVLMATFCVVRLCYWLIDPHSFEGYIPEGMNIMMLDFAAPTSIACATLVALCWARLYSHIRDNNLAALKLGVATTFPAFLTVTFLGYVGIISLDIVAEFVDDEFRRNLLIVCKLTATLWKFGLVCFFMIMDFLWRRMLGLDGQVVRSTTNSVILKRNSKVVTTLFVSTATYTVITTIQLNQLFSEEYYEGWNWFVFEGSSRLIEIGCILIQFAGLPDTRGRKRQGKTPGGTVASRRGSYESDENVSQYTTYNDSRTGSKRSKKTLWELRSGGSHRRRSSGGSSYVASPEATATTNMNPTSLKLQTTSPYAQLSTIHLDNLVCDNKNTNGQGGCAKQRDFFRRTSASSSSSATYASTPLHSAPCTPGGSSKALLAVRNTPYSSSPIFFPPSSNIADDDSSTPDYSAAPTPTHKFQQLSSPIAAVRKISEAIADGTAEENSDSDGIFLPGSTDDKGFKDDKP